MAESDGSGGIGEHGLPSVRWGNETVEFQLAKTVGESPAFAALVFAFYGDRVLLCDIAGRGWCVPSGRLESGESAEAGARRETLEEAGVELGRLLPLGHFRFTSDQGDTRLATAFVADVVGWVDFDGTDESRGRQWVAWEDLAETYYAWDPLLAAVFETAWETRSNALVTGFTIPETFRQP